MVRIYLDYNASTPPAPEVVEAMRPYFHEHLGTPPAHTGQAAQPEKLWTKPESRWPRC